MFPTKFKLGYCVCGCETPINIRTTKGRLQFYTQGWHQTRGKDRQLEKSAKWNGGRTKRPDGYIWVKKPDHQLANNQGYVVEHRLVMEQHIGRNLRPNEVVHHINEIRDDNRIENLELMTISEHMTHHNKRDMSNRFCDICGYTTYIRKDENRPVWYLSNGKYVCNKCNHKLKYGSISHYTKAIVELRE